MSLLNTDARLARDSYYEATVQREDAHPRLEGSVHCDVAVVGGGLAGLSAALELAQRGFQVRVLEGRRLGSGASGRNGGQAIHGLACDMEVIEAQLGPEPARRIFAMSMQALQLMRDRIRLHGIDCGWRDGFLGAATSARKARSLLAWAERMRSVYGLELQSIRREQVGAWIGSPRYHGAVHDPLSGHLHPLKYTLGLARAACAAGAQLHENTPVIALEHGPNPRLRTASGTVHARHVLLAGNVYLQGLAPALASRIMPVGTYIATTEPLGAAVARSLIPSGSAVCDTNFVLDYYRCTEDHRMLYGGRVSYSTVTPARLMEAMRRRMVHTFPQLHSARLSHAWGGFVDITLNRAPDFGRLQADGRPALRPDAPSQVYYLQGFSGHGLALSGMAGQLAARAIAGDAEGFDCFARLRHRNFPGGRWLRTPALVLGMSWYRLRDALG